MSTDTGFEDRPDADAVLRRIQEWYHVPALIGILAFVLWVRLRPFGRFVRDGVVFFSGNDAYYHYRATMYTVRNWPSRLFADPWTHFPYGTSVGNFGSLMDQVVATVALLVGLGDPSARQVAVVAAVTPAVVSAGCAVLVYFLAKRLTGSRTGGVIGALVLALLPTPTWITRGSVGFYDHHIAEVFLMTAAVLAMVVALGTVRRERPVYEQVQDRDWRGLKPSVKASAIAGVGIALYLLAWAPGQVLVGIFGLFFVLAMSAAVLRGDSPEHLAFAGVVSSLVAAILILPWLFTWRLSTSTLSTLQVLLLVGVALACVTMAALARVWEREGLDATGYPVSVAAVGVVGIGVLWLVLPGAIDTIVNGFSRIIPIGQSATTLTVAEAQPMEWSSLWTDFYRWYGFAFLTGLIAMLWMLGRYALAARPRAEYLLVVVWSAFLVSMAITQVRFHYYLVVAVAALNGWLVVQVLALVDYPSLDRIGDLETYHVLTVFVIVLILVVPVASPLASVTAADAADQQGPGPVQYWQGSLDWMSDNTPAPGQYGGSDNAMDYYGPFEETGDYAYPEGAYGVMSWWDYGHWITVEGERVPNANPFQEGPPVASAFFQEQNETRANRYLDALPADEIGGGDLMNASIAELDAAIASRTDQEAGEVTRYVVIDDQMAGGKFSAITRWTGPGYGYYVDTDVVQIGDQNYQLPVRNRTYEESMLGRLYHHDGSGLEHYRLVHESDATSTLLSVAQRTSQGNYRGTPYVGVDLLTLRQNAPQVYNSVVRGDGQLAPYNVRLEAAVRTYERVEGATITGETEPGATVTVSLSLPRHPNIPAQNQLFRRYTQQVNASADGSFAVTVPYATDNQLGPADGYTDASFVPNSTYTVASSANESATGIEVPEPAIYGGEEIAVELEPDDQDSDGQEGANGDAGTNGDGDESPDDGEAPKPAAGTDTTATVTDSTATGAATTVAGADDYPSGVAPASGPAGAGLVPLAARAG